jgi:SEC-C motif
MSDAPGRNDPCPCGSGKKYKHCHLKVDEGERAGPSRWHELDRRLIETMGTWAVRRFGDPWREFAGQNLADESLLFDMPVLLFHRPFKGKTTAQWFVEERGPRLSAQEREWLEAQGRAWLTIWEAVEVDPGRSIRVVDLLTGEKREVREVAASRVVRIRHGMLARIVDIGDESLFAGTHPRPLPPAPAAEAIARFRKLRKSRRKIRPEELRGEQAVSLLVEAWEETCAEFDDRLRKGPRLQNTDGEPLLLIIDRYHYGLHDEARLRAALEGLAGIEVEDETTYLFLRRIRKRGSKDDITVMASAALKQGRLELETNSLRRADDVRAKVESVVGSILSKHTRELSDPMNLYDHRGDAERDREPRSEEALAIMREFKENHYAAWVEDDIPALGGKTPRQAMKTPRGRKQLAILLKDLENREASLPEAERFDVRKLYDVLGLRRD